MQLYNYYYHKIILFL